MTNQQYLKTDIKSMEHSIAFHEARIENYGKPNPKGPGHSTPFADINPQNLLPYLKKILKEMKAELKTL
jgi:hypothetical protein